MLGIQACCYRNLVLLRAAVAGLSLAVNITFPPILTFKWRRAILLGEELYLPYSPNEIQVGHRRRHTFPTSRSGRTLVQKRISSRGSFCWPVRTNRCFVYMVRLQSTSGNAKGDAFIHKSKENSNGTFSVGKTWKLSELRAVEVVGVSYVHFIVLLRADSNAALDIQHHPSEDVQVADRGIE